MKGFNNPDWIAENQPVAWFDFNGNGRIDFTDVVQPSVHHRASVVGANRSGRNLLSHAAEHMP